MQRPMNKQWMIPVICKHEMVRTGISGANWNKFCADFIQK